MWFLIGCVEAPRELSVIEASTPQPRDTEPLDSGDTGEIGAPPDACQYGGGEEHVDALVVSYCARVTPEPAGDEEAVDTGALPPPCGFVNMVGAVGLGGGAEDPSLLYCDSDLDGGVRFARYDAAHGTIETEMLVPGLCWWDPAAGTLAQTSAGYLGLWVEYVEEQGVAVEIGGAVLTDDGRVHSLPDPIAIPTAVWHPLLVGSDTPVLLVADTDHALWSVPISPDGEAQGPPVDTGVRPLSYGAAVTSESVVVAWCDDDHQLGATVLDRDGGFVRDAGVTGTCGGQTVPSVAADGERVAVAWDDGEGGHVTLLDGWQVDVAGELPQLLWRDGDLLVLDSYGTLSRFDAGGELLGSWYHPAVGVIPGSLYGLRTALVGDTLLVGVIGIDSYFIEGGHINTFNYVEISAVPLP